MDMETICLRLENNVVKEIDQKLAPFRYGTRTEFLRDAIRSKLSDLEKEEIFRKLQQNKGKYKSKMELETAKELAAKELIKRLNLQA